MRLLLLALALTGCDLVPPDRAGADAASGRELFVAECSRCHGADGQGTDYAPDLWFRASGLDAEGIVDTVLDGEGRMDPVPVSIEEAERVAGYVVNGLF
jgi:mono/diheme cytochrome c family protein